MTTRIVELRRGILKKNDELAAGLRAGFANAGVLVLNLVSSPGTGKTALLELTLKELRARGARVRTCAAIFCTPATASAMDASEPPASSKRLFEPRRMRHRSASLGTLAKATCAAASDLAYSVL